MSFTTSLKVGGYVPLTTTDFPGELAAVVFCQGCPWQCRYCHNPHLIPADQAGKFTWPDIYNRLKKRIRLLDGVVFSGGEPTMQPRLVDALKAVKDLGFKIGLHTAGQYPDRLAASLPYLDWVGMDVKAPAGKYEKITRRPEQYSKQTRSMRLLLESRTAHEFRTTAHPALLYESDIREIADNLLEIGAKHFAVQYFRNDGCNDDDLLSHDATTHYLSAEMIQYLSKRFETFTLRNI